MSSDSLQEEMLCAGHVRGRILRLCVADGQWHSPHMMLYAIVVLSLPTHEGGSSGSVSSEG